MKRGIVEFCRGKRFYGGNTHFKHKNIITVNTK